MDVRTEAQVERDKVAWLRAELDQLRREHRNLHLLLAAVVVEAGGEVEVSDSTLVAVEGEVSTLDESVVRGIVRVRAR